MKRLFLPLVALSAITLSFINKPKYPHEMMLLGCSASSGERNERLNQMVAYMAQGPMSLIGYETGDQPGLYCYRIYFIGE